MAKRKNSSGISFPIPSDAEAIARADAAATEIGNPKRTRKLCKAMLQKLVQFHGPASNAPPEFGWQDVGEFENEQEARAAINGSGHWRIVWIRWEDETEEQTQTTIVFKSSAPKATPAP